MIAAKETAYTKDVSRRKLFVVREFDAPVERVWKAWTESELLDQWWAPSPWKAHTISMDFREGGRWHYYMEGPDNERHYSLCDFISIVPNKSYSGLDAFCDEKGNVLTEMPRSKWTCKFNPDDHGTRVEIEVSFDTNEDMKKLVEMGFEEGFAAAHKNLDELLAK